MKSLHSEEIISDLKLSTELSEPELRGLSMKYDYLYFHNVSFIIIISFVNYYYVNWVYV